MIEGPEAVQGVRDYFDGTLTQDEALDLVLHYFATVPLDTPEAVAISPTPTPTPSENLVLLQLPGEMAVMAQWPPIEGATVYHLAYRHSGSREWTTLNVKGSPYTINRGIRVGRYEVRVRPWFSPGFGEWSESGYLTVTVPPTPTPAPVPTPTATPTPAPVLPTSGNCLNLALTPPRTLMLHNVAFSGTVLLRPAGTFSLRP